MITLTDLHPRHIELLNTMWAMNSSDQYDTWKCSLPLEVMNDVDSLEILLILETIDELYVKDFPDAKNVLSKFVLKG
jgi:hypothetical protein